MKADIRDRWVAALTSGEYKQGQGRLRVGKRYCCLGVLCDLAAGNGVGEWSSGDRYIIDPDSPRIAMPPLEVLDWAGLDEEDARELSVMNDDGKTFAEIADFINAERV